MDPARHACVVVLACGNSALIQGPYPYLCCKCEMTFCTCSIRKELKPMTLLSKFAEGLIGRFENWRARQRAYRELSSLDDRPPADIGAARSDIPFVLRQSPAAVGAVRIDPTSRTTNVRRAAECGL